MKKKTRIFISLFVIIGLFLNLTFSCKKEEEETKYILKVTTTNLSNILQKTASCGGDVSFNGDTLNVSRGICWSLSANPTIADSISFCGYGVGSFLGILRNLTANTTYYVRAYATNYLGTEYGQEYRFTTLMNDGPAESITDVDGNVYRTAYIGGKRWMTENLRTLHYNNGEQIAINLSNTDWQSANNAACSIYNYRLVDGINSNEEMVTYYGVLYNWFAISDSRKICPNGWHVATEEEWTDLTKYIALKKYYNVSRHLKSCRQVDSPLGGNCATTNHPRWNSNAYFYGLDSYSFSALPAGARRYDGSFINLGTHGSWWTSTEVTSWSARSFDLSYNQEIFGTSEYNKTCGFSIRCVQD